MSIESAKQALTAGANDLKKTQEGLDAAQESFSASHLELGGVLIRTQVTLPEHLAAAKAEYDKAVQALARASRIYNEKVQPRLADSGLAALGTPQARAIVEDVDTIKSRLDSATGRLMADFLTEENSFSVAEAKTSQLSADIERFRQGMSAELLEEGAMLPRMGMAIHTAHDSILAYRDGLGSNT